MIKYFNRLLILTFLLTSKYMLAFQVQPPPPGDNVDDVGVPVIPDSGIIFLLLLGSFLGKWYLSKQRQND